MTMEPTNNLKKKTGLLMASKQWLYDGAIA